MKASWKTTLGGLLSSFGLLFSNSSDPKAHSVGVIAAAAGTLLIGASARDNKVSSEDVGIR
jgi:drug/metabolite transporter (DMT)-like permease